MVELIKSLKAGDKVRCLKSIVEDRKGREFSVIAGNLNSRKRPWMVSKSFLLNSVMSGDIYEKV